MRRWAEITSFLIGVLVAASLLVGWQVPRGRAELGADLRLSIVQSPSLGLSQTGTVLDETHFRPGDRAVAAVTVSNRGPHAVRVAVRSQRGTDRVLDRLLRVDVRAGSTRIFSGRLAGLAQGGARPLALPPAGSLLVTVAVHLPRRVAAAYAGRSTQSAVRFEELP
jgi:hypothetical protein